MNAQHVQLESTRTADIDEPLRAAIVAMCTAAHGQDFRELFTRYLPPDGLHVIGRIGDRVVGHAVVTTRWLRYDHTRRMRTAYVDAVATAPDHQRRGIGRAVMRRVEELVTENAYEIACLETDRAGFYTRLGWETWHGSLAGLGQDGLVPTPDQTGIMILRLPSTPPLELDYALIIEIDGRIW